MLLKSVGALDAKIEDEVNAESRPAHMRGCRNCFWQGLSDAQVTRVQWKQKWKVEAMKDPINGGHSLIYIGVREDGDLNPKPSSVLNLHHLP